MLKWAETTSFGQKSIGKMSFIWLVMVTSVGWKSKLLILWSIEGMGAKLGEGMSAIEQCILDTSAGEQLSDAATDIKLILMLKKWTTFKCRL